MTSFKLVCLNCESVGIQNVDEQAPASTMLKCSNCGCDRGPLGELREMAVYVELPAKDDVQRA